MHHPHFPPADRYVARCGRLDTAVVQRRITPAPAFLRGLRILFVSDIHLCPDTTSEQTDRFVEKIAGLSPDILLLGGDYSDMPEETEKLFNALRGVRPSLGSFGVLGNNDVEAWKEKPDALRDIMGNAGCRLLVNETAAIALDGGTLYIGGVDEFKYGRSDASGLFPASPSPEHYRILLSHYPIEPASHPDLMLCGHTHGGQFNLFGLTPFAIGFERFTRPRVSTLAISGLHDLGDMKILVSKGIGASRIQLRIGVRPEMDLLSFG